MVPILGSFWSTILQYVATKLLDKTVGPGCPSRTDACRTFLALHSTLADAEHLAVEVMALMPDPDERRLKEVMQWLASHCARLDEVSAQFLDSLPRILESVTLYDPRLGKMLRKVVAGKKRFLLVASFPKILEAISEQIRYQDELESALALTILTAPSTDELDTIYDGVGQRISREDTIEWPEGVIASLAKAHLAKRVFRKKDRHDLAALHRLLVEQAGELKAARETLAEFIRSEFSIEDLLWVTRE
jgi:hypothetical protein